MISNIEKYKGDLDKLIILGQSLQLAIQAEYLRDDFDRLYKKEFGKEKLEKLKAGLPSF